MRTHRDSYAFGVGGLTIAVRRGNSALPLTLDPQRARFVAADTAPHSTVTVQASPLDDRPLGRCLFSATSHGLWELFEHNGRRLIRIGRRQAGTLPTTLASFDPSFREGTVTVNTAVHPPGHRCDPLHWPLDELIVLHLLAQGRGLQLHACGTVLPNGRGGIFVGMSGAGKSTLARSWLRHTPGTQILSDDRVIVRERGGQFVVYGTPWHGTEGLAAPVCAPVQAIYLLRQAGENRLTPLPVSSGLIARLLACAFVMMYDPAAIAFAAAFLARLTDAVPCYDFANTPNADAINCVLQSLGA